MLKFLMTIYCYWGFLVGSFIWVGVAKLYALLQHTYKLAEMFFRVVIKENREKFLKAAKNL